MYEKFEQLLLQKGVRVSVVSRETGIDKTTFSKWKKGLYTPKIDKIEKIADYFGVTIAYFYDDNTEEYVLSSKEKTLVEIYNELNEEGKELLLERATELQKLGYIKNNKSGMVSA